MPDEIYLDEEEKAALDRIWTPEAVARRKREHEEYLRQQRDAAQKRPAKTPPAKKPPVKHDESRHDVGTGGSPPDPREDIDLIAGR